MRSILLLSVLLFAAAVVAVKDDVACVVHSDDCGRCVSNGCNWCSDGYCVSKESDICEASKVATECGVKPIVQDRQHGQRQSAPVCEAIYDCNTCAQTAGCSVCRQQPFLISKCSTTGTQCTAGIYNAQFEWWILDVKINPSINWTAQPCLSIKPPASNSPTLKIKSKIFAVNPGSTFPRDYIRARILAFLALYIKGYTADYITIAEPVVITTGKRQTLDSTSSDATALVKFADSPDVSAQAVAATLVAYFDDTSITPDSQPITASPLLPGTGASGGIISTGNVVNRGGNKGIDISKGALAGIIIGCVIFGALLIALIAWLILRRRDSYPQAFRSPAAAYRP